MSENHSSPTPKTDKSAKRTKPEKPYPEFPLTAHPAGYWCKKIRGRIFYFGKWDDPDGALKEYLKQKDALHAGRALRPDTTQTTVKDVANAFLNEKKARIATGELSLRTWQGYKLACDFLIESVGKNRLMADLGPDDFTPLRNRLAKRYGPHGLGTNIKCIRCACKYAYDAGLIDRPVRFGPDFKAPSKKVYRLHRAKQGTKLFTRQEILTLLLFAPVHVEAMILLGINAGFGNADCGRLSLSAVDLNKGIIDFPRPKTGIPRRCVLWPETIDALREVIAKRPEVKNPADAGLVFLTKFGMPWFKDDESGPLPHEMTKLLRALGINGRKGLGFYTLRHVFRTVADESKDQPAVDYIMGHEVPHMSSIYRETISQERLKAVADNVRAWLFQESTKVSVSRADI